MHVSKTIKTENGDVVFEGTLTPAEFDMVLEVGLSYLFRMGVLKTVVVSEGDSDEEIPEGTNIQ